MNEPTRPGPWPGHDTSVTDRGLTRHGIVQFRRRWVGESPRAAALLLHGMGEHSGRYEHVGARLVARGFDVVAIDHRGHGWSGGRRGHIGSFDEFLDDVEDQMAEVRRLGLPVVLIGHSMGGLIALAYTVSGRPGPDALALSGPAIGGTVPRWMRTLVDVLGTRVPTLSVSGPIDGSVLATDPRVGEAYKADALVWRSATVGFGSVLFEAMDDTRSRVDRLTVPTYVVHGADDKLVPVASSRVLDGRPGVVRRELPGLRHEVFNEPGGLNLVDDIADWALARIA